MVVIISSMSPICTMSVHRKYVLRPFDTPDFILTILVDKMDMHTYIPKVCKRIPFLSNKRSIVPIGDPIGEYLC